MTYCNSYKYYKCVHQQVDQRYHTYAGDTSWHFASYIVYIYFMEESHVVVHTCADISSTKISKSQGRSTQIRNF